MAMNIITGSNGIGDFLEIQDKNIVKIIKDLESMNSPLALPMLKGMDFLNSFTRQIEGVNGTTEGFQEYRVYASDDGSFSDALTYKESYAKWYFTRQGFVVKDKDFTQDLLQQAEETDQDLSVIVNEKIQAIAKMYLNGYLPNRAYETLFQIPAAGGEYRTAPIGFLRDVELSEEWFKITPSSDAFLIRNHYRCIGNTTKGVLADDIEDMVEYLSEYNDISDSNIVGLGSRYSLYKLSNTLMDTVNKDIFNRTGQPTQDICGVQFIINEFMPKDWLLFVAGDAPHLITKLVSPKPYMRGMAIYKENGFQKLESIYDLVGSQFKIMPEGYHLTGRHYGAFLYLGADKGSPITEDGRVTRKCSEEQLQLLSDHAHALKNKWYRGLR